MVKIDISPTHLFDLLRFGLTKDGIFCNFITHNIIWSNQKNELLAYRWLRMHAMFEASCFPAVVRVSDVILRILLIR